MIREVDLVSYLPPFVAEYKETNLTLTAENPEFVLVWEAADRALKNEFIATADEYGIGRFERLLHILPSVSDTLEIRRARVQTKWFTALPYTWRMFMQKMEGICGPGCLASYTEKGCYMIRLEACIGLQWQIESLIDVAEGMLPCNMGMHIKNVLYLDMETPAPIVRPGWFGYAVEYRGVIFAGESSMLVKTICMHILLPVWGGTLYNGGRKYDGATRYNARRSYGLRVKLKTVLELYTEQAVRCAAVYSSYATHEMTAEILMMMLYSSQLREALGAAVCLYTAMKSPSGEPCGMSIETRRNVVRHNGMRRYNGKMKYNALYKKEEVE